MNVLLVRDGNHQFITNFTKWLVKEDETIKIDVLTRTKINKENVNIYKNIYSHLNIRYINFFSKIPFLRKAYRYLYYIFFINKNIEKYGLIHFHFIDQDAYFLSKFLKKSHSSIPIIFSIWGSDFYRLPKKNEKHFIQACNAVDEITFTNQQTLDDFKDKFNWSKNNLQVIRFGIAPLEDLKELNLTNKECKQRLGWNENKIAITIGSNLSPYQQHEEIINAFLKTPILNYKDDIQLVFPFTYGGTPEYKKHMLSLVEDLPYEKYVYPHFLTDEKVAMIRKASDIMINLQKTDQFSGAMQEHLYAKNVVITGVWLPYGLLKETGAWFVEVDHLDEIPDKLSYILNDFENFQADMTTNPSAIVALSSWGKNIKQWLNLYKKY
jgi:glycosyltransferase involved in cell wall biosynthesis